MSTHEIVVDENGHRVAVCSAVPGAKCRLVCSTQKCETWGDGQCACGALADGGACNEVGWLNAWGLKCCYDGNVGEISEGHVGPIAIGWRGELECYVWAEVAAEAEAESQEVDR